MVMHRQVWNVLLAGILGFFGVFSLFQCAHPLPPPGGPRDTIPPTVLQTIPTSGTVRWERPQISIVFSEEIAVQSPARYITIFPPTNFRAEWVEDDELEIHLDSLRSNQTYVVTVSPAFRDVEGNTLEKAVTLVFSTGDTISQYGVVGRIWGRHRGSKTIVLLTQEGTKWQDSLWYQQPDYWLEVGADGTFQFPALLPRRYRIAAFEDRNGNGRYDRGWEAATVGWREVVLGPVVTDTIELWMSPVPDREPPKLIGATPLTARLLRLRFSEPLDTASIQPVAFWCRDTATGGMLKPSGAGLEPGKQTTVLLAFATPLASSIWDVGASTVADTAGNVLDTLQNQVQFRMPILADTLVPRIAELPLKGDSLQLLLPFFHWIFAFSVPMDTGATAAAISLHRLDSGQTVPLQKRWKSQTHIELQPVDTLLPQQWYELRIDTVAIAVGGVSLPSPVRIRFRTPDLRDFGEFVGEIQDAHPGGPYILIVQGIGYGMQYRHTLQQPGTWRIPSVVPDRYQLWCFEDANRNGRFDVGSIDPYQPSERFTVWQTVVRVAPRWTTEGIQIRMPGHPAASRSE